MKCPFTNKDIDAIHPFNKAVLYHKKGEETKTECSLVPSLISHLYSNTATNTTKNTTTSTSVNNTNKDDISSSVCLRNLTNQSIESIYDGISNKILLEKDDDVNNDNEDNEDDNFNCKYDIIFFKFNKHSYHLSVFKNGSGSSSTSTSSQLIRTLFEYLYNQIVSITKVKDNNDDNDLMKDTLAQERIGTVLGIDTKHNMKILHKGKVIYPCRNNNKTTASTLEEISNKLIEISLSDYKEKRRTPSLVVMGTRKVDIIHETQTETATAAKKYMQKKIQRYYRRMIESRYYKYRYLFLFGSWVFLFLMKRQRLLATGKASSSLSDDTNKDIPQLLLFTEKDHETIEL